MKHGDVHHVSITFRLRHNSRQWRAACGGRVENGREVISIQRNWIKGGLLTYGGGSVVTKEGLLGGRGILCGFTTVELIRGTSLGNSEEKK